MMRVSDLRYGGVPAWPPAWTSSLPPTHSLATTLDSILRSARVRGAGVDIEIEIDGERYHGLLLWDGQPSADVVVRALQMFVGRALRDAGEGVIPAPPTRHSA